MNATMTMDMTMMSEAELEQVEGGIMPLLVMAVGAYYGMLTKVESYPEYYTWTMDWYYD